MLRKVTGDDIAEEIVWCASRPEHVNVAQLCESYTSGINCWEMLMGRVSRHAGAAGVGGDLLAKARVIGAELEEYEKSMHQAVLTEPRAVLSVSNDPKPSFPRPRPVV